MPIDTIVFDYQVMKQTKEELTSRPNDGIYIHGLFLEGARWNSKSGVLEESLPKILYDPAPVVRSLQPSRLLHPSGMTHTCVGLVCVCV